MSSSLKNCKLWVSFAVGVPGYFSSEPAERELRTVGVRRNCLVPAEISLLANNRDIFLFNTKLVMLCKN